MTLPGTRLLAVARLWFDAPTVDGVFEPLVADSLEDHPLESTDVPGPPNGPSWRQPVYGCLWHAAHGLPNQPGAGIV